MELIRKPLKRKLEMTWLSKLLQEIPFFRKLAESISQQAFVSLIKKISHEFVPKHSPVFRKGIFLYYIL